MKLLSYLKQKPLIQSSSSRFDCVFQLLVCHHKSFNTCYFEGAIKPSTKESRRNNLSKLLSVDSA